MQKSLLSMAVAVSVFGSGCFTASFAEEQKPITLSNTAVTKTEIPKIANNSPISSANETKTLKGRVQNEFHVLNEIQLNINDVTGPGKSSSSLTDGVLYLENLNLYGKGNVSGLDYSFNIGGRATNDNRIDVRSMTITSLQGRASYNNNFLNAGDVFESFSQYSLNTNLKGASYKYANSEDNLPDVTFVYGYAYPRWESFFRATNARAIQRVGYGVNLRHDLTPNLTAGLSFLRSQDSERQTAEDPMYHDSVYSLDYEYRPITGLTIRGESAFSDADAQYSEGDGHVGYFGNAHRIEAIGDGGPSRVTLEWERVSPHFETFLGSASQDRQKAKAKWRYKYNKNVTFNTGFMWLMTGLQDDDARTNSYKPEFGVNVKRLFGRKYSEADLTFKIDRKSSRGQRQFDHFTTFEYRDRFLGFLDSDSTFSFTNYNTNKHERKNYEYNYFTSLSSRHTLGMVVLKPSVNAGSNFIDDEFNNTVDKIIEYSTGLGIDIPKYKVTSNWKFGQNILKSGGGDDSNKLFANISFYYKPSFLGMFNNSTIYLRAAVNDFNFQTKNRNFNEKSISMGINIPL